MWLADVFIRSQLFIAICAIALGIETSLVSETPISIPVLGVIFFSSLFIYNGARMQVSLSTRKGSAGYSVNVEGSRLSVALSIISVVILFAFLTACSWKQLLVFMLASLFSLAYTIPFKHNGKSWQGLRQNLLLKNVVLSFTWAVATVLLPLTEYNTNLLDTEIVFMFFRRLFFIYSLAVIYDLRDLEPDLRAGMETIALRFGEKGTQKWALAALGIFVLLVIADPYLVPGSWNYAGALLLSAVGAAVVVLNTGKIRKKKYYSLVVDANMLLQLILVWLAGTP